LRELALHLLDIAENSISAHAKTIRIRVEENTLIDRLRIRVIDDGIGIDADRIARVIDPFVTSRTTRKVGLGIPLLKAAAEACNGSFSIQSEPGKGTQVEVEFQHSHIDRMPLGNLESTILTLMIGSPEVNWIFCYNNNGQEFVLDDAEIKETLAGVSLSEPSVLKFLREYLSEGIADVKAAAPSYSK
jgi:anti-sigma regulatory factor (Ser/Thr protein kinase)